MATSKLNLTQTTSRDDIRWCLVAKSAARHRNGGEGALVANTGALIRIRRDCWCHASHSGQRTALMVHIGVEDFLYWATHDNCSTAEPGSAVSSVPCYCSRAKVTYTVRILTTDFLQRQYYCPSCPGHQPACLQRQVQSLYVKLAFNQCCFVARRYSQMARRTPTM